ncbi:NAD(P)H-binding protein [Kineococcus aurantiacus]|uniref:Nucleoside-diphosphate-sugar epimerase n=1 Tax=Kineococcus aurantiacus TaxID=37633 RepID=A0A7Y9DPH9_9ACTN|nr:nucleoside-diphosphate-sugar epimerase [Kineococcus aurantiacus]
MRIVIAGGHGKIALLLGALAAGRGDEVVGLVRDPGHLEDLRAAGVRGVVRDLESATGPEVADDLAGADAVVFAAGAGPGSGAARKDSVDHRAAVLLADAAERAGVGAYLLISSIGVDRVRDGAVPDGVEEVFVAYLRAKLAAEEDLLARRGLRVGVLRPASLTDDPPSGSVLLDPAVDTGRVARADVAAVCLGLLDRLVAGPAPAPVLGLAAGDVPVEEAVARV